MRFVEGASLQDLIAERGRVPPGRAARVVARVADALDAAHARGLVHRDVKPANVLIADPDGEEHVYLSDFGLSAGSGERDGAAAGWAGTLAYLAPEQIRGEPARRPHRRLRPRLRALPRPHRAAAVRRRRRGGGARGAPHQAPPPARRRGAGPAAGARRGRAAGDGQAPRGPLRDRRASWAGRPSRPATTWRCSRAGGRRRARPGARRAPAGGGAPAARPGGRAARRRRGRRAAGACAVLVGRGGLGDWAREGLAAAQEVAARDRAFRLVLVLLPGGPDPGDPSLAYLADQPVGGPARGGRRRARRRRTSSAPCAGPTSGPGLPSATGGVCPYRGLEAFREEDADLYFGREQDVSRWSGAPPRQPLRRRARALRQRQELAGAGRAAARAPPGRARPAAGWRVLDMVPGARPLAALAAQLAHLPGAGGPSPADLAADERTPGRGDARALEGRPRRRTRAGGGRPARGGVHALPGRGRAGGVPRQPGLRRHDPGRADVVVATMRADFYHRLAEHPELRGLVASQQVLLGPAGRPRPAPRHRGAGTALRPGAGARPHPPDPHRRRRPPGDPAPDGAPAAGGLAAPPRPHAHPGGLRRLGRRRGRPGPPGQRDLRRDEPRAPGGRPARAPAPHPARRGHRGHPPPRHPRRAGHAAGRGGRG